MLNIKFYYKLNKTIETDGLDEIIERDDCDAWVLGYGNRITRMILDYLQLDSFPKIVIDDKIHTELNRDGFITLGQYSHKHKAIRLIYKHMFSGKEENINKVALLIAETLCHELIHYKQDLENRLTETVCYINNKSSRKSKIEKEAVKISREFVYHNMEELLEKL